jgi:hypothetical protein
MFGQAATQIVDTQGFGVAEWLGIATAITLVLGAVVGAIVQLTKLRRENSEQHAEGRALIHDVADRLLDIHSSIERVDTKVERLDERLDRHESVHHRGRRRW